MKKIAFMIIFCISLVGVVAKVSAEEPTDILTDDQRVLISNNCTGLQTTLNRIHQNDALARHDRGQLYRALVDKLMSPLNQRVASNKLDGSELVQTTASYNSQYQVFFTAYREYELALSGALQISCTKQPTAFYDAIVDAREKRIAVHAASVRLVELASLYRTQFIEFRATVKAEAGNTQ